MTFNKTALGILGGVCLLAAIFGVVQIISRISRIDREMAEDRAWRSSAREIILNHGNGVSTTYTHVSNVRDGIGWCSFTDSQGRRIDYRGSFTIIR